MKIRVRYFAFLREAAGKEHETVELSSEGASVDDVLGVLGSRGGELGELLRRRPTLFAVNGEYAARDSSVREGDEVALFPPVSGG